MISNAREGKFDLVRNIIVENVGKAKMQAYFYNDPGLMQEQLEHTGKLICIF